MSRPTRATLEKVRDAILAAVDHPCGAIPITTIRKRDGVLREWEVFYNLQKSAPTRIARLAVEYWTSWPRERLMAAIQKRLPAGVTAESCQVRRHERSEGDVCLFLVVQWLEERKRRPKRRIFKEYGERPADSEAPRYSRAGGD